MDTDLFIDIGDDHFGSKKHWQVAKKRVKDPEIKGFQIFFSVGGVEEAAQELLQHGKECWDLYFAGQYEKCIAQGTPVLPNIRRHADMFWPGTQLHLDVHFAESLILFSLALSHAKRPDYMNLWHPQSILIENKNNEDLIKATTLIEEMFTHYDFVGGPKRSQLYANALVDLGHVYHRRGLWDIAITAYDKGIEFNPAQPVAHYHLGAIAYFSRRFEDYYEHIRNALDYRQGIGPQGLRNCLGSLALSLICLGQYEEAEKPLNELWPEHSDYVIAAIFEEPNLDVPSDNEAFKGLKKKYRLDE